MVRTTPGYAPIRRLLEELTFNLDEAYRRSPLAPPPAGLGGVDSDGV